jgi:predicted transcriptional regulator of viral defense system
MRRYKSYDLGKIYKSPQTVFTIKELSLFWGVNQPKLVWARANDYVRRGKLYRIKRGIYAKDEDYDKFELATKIYTPSYISLETVLAKEGVIFQYYETIFVVSYLTRALQVDMHKIKFRKIKNKILINSEGISQEENYFIATKERAFLDAVYLYKNYYFDNLDTIDKNKVFELVKIYRNKKLIERVKKYFDTL